MLGFGTIAKKVFGSENDRFLKAIRPKIDAITALEPNIEKMSDEAKNKNHGTGVR